MTLGARASLGCLVAFLTPFMVISVGTAVAALRMAAAGRWGPAAFLALFAAVFGTFAIAMFGGALWSYPQATRAAAQQRAHPAEPWLWRADWAAGRSVCRAGAGATVALALAVVWNLISAPTIVFVPREVARGNTLALLGLIFPTIGIGLLAWAARQALRWHTFGSSALALPVMPVPVGEHFEAVLEAALPAGAPHGVRLRLSCLRRTTTGSGRSRSTWEHVLWQDERPVTGPFAPRPGSRVGVPVAFDLPPNAPSTNTANPNDEIVWRLDATADVPGVDYVASFDVPVFGTAATTAVAAPVRGFEPPPAAERPPHPSVEVIPTARGGTAFVFGSARELLPALSATAFLALWLGVVWLLVHLGAPLLFPIVFGAFALLLTVIVANLWTGSCRVVIEDGSVTVTRAILGIPRVSQVRCADVRDAVVEVGMTVGLHAYWNVRLVGPEGRTADAGGPVRDKREADWIARQMKGLATAR